MIFRLFVEKIDSAHGAAKLRKEFNTLLKIPVSDVRVFVRYDCDFVSGDDFETCVDTVFSEPPVDRVSRELPNLEGFEVFGVEFLPGQYDQRADSAAQCAQLLLRKDRPVIRCATVYAVKGATRQQVKAIKKYLINPVEAQEAALVLPSSLNIVTVPPSDAVVFEGFINMDTAALTAFHAGMGFAMTVQDLEIVKGYYSQEGRNPNESELKVIDTYWSDHCRHTTFLTELKTITIKSDNPSLARALESYTTLYSKFNAARKDKYRCLMDIATIAVKEISSRGALDNLDASDEINACSIVVKADVDGKQEDWLVMFKNETHNHPTEIEPYGGAATCLGGAIRDPLSGRVYVYQAMRVTGAADPTVPFEQTLGGKLPQRVITKTAAAGFSSYGNQIGLATGLVSEVYHPDYVAKRLETGFVVGAAPKNNVVRAKPLSGDVVVLIGGETGRDGCGGATGSSKAHTKESVDLCGAEVQKGNPLTERKIQRLFRNPDFTQMIKKCNDFGAGGVCVAIGELSEGLDIMLDRVPKKYEGLSITELAISESQERMAIVIDPADLEKVIALAAEENVSATEVALITDTNRMRMFLNGRAVIDIDRDLLNSNGAKQYADVVIKDNKVTYFDSAADDVAGSYAKGDYVGAIEQCLSALNVASQKGLGEMFDSTIGAGSVLMPYGGKNQLTPAYAMAAKLPVTKGTTDTATVAAYAYNPYLMSESPFVGAVYSVVVSVIKAVAAGAKTDSIRLTFQEYFRRLKTAEDWGLPAAALLGALDAQLNLNMAAIGGKDSMSGTFENINVPSTLISFALGIASAAKVTSNVITRSGTIYRIKLKRDEYQMPDYGYIKTLLKVLEEGIYSGKINYVQIVEEGGAVAAAVKSALGNGIGLTFASVDKMHFAPLMGDLLIMTDDCNDFNGLDYEVLAEANDSGNIVYGGKTLDFAAVKAAYTSKFESVFPTSAESAINTKLSVYDYMGAAVSTGAGFTGGMPKVFIPVFPGTNCEYDTARAFAEHGAKSDICIIKNRSVTDIDDSVKRIVKGIDSAQIIAFPGGFSGGDEPDGSGKFIAATFRNPLITDAVNRFLARGGLIIGICNGFQALVKLGLLHYGAIKPMTNTSPTLTFNTIGKHMSGMVNTRVASVMSPWLRYSKVGGVYTVPISHGEGRFVATEQELDKLAKNGQIFSQYCTADGVLSTEMPHNPNGSMYAIEGITSIDGRIIGKMGHIERRGVNLYKNLPVSEDIGIFRAGVDYFK